MLMRRVAVRVRLQARWRASTSHWVYPEHEALLLPWAARTLKFVLALAPVAAVFAAAPLALTAFAVASLPLAMPLAMPLSLSLALAAGRGSLGRFRQRAHGAKRETLGSGPSAGRHLASN